MEGSHPGMLGIYSGKWGIGVHPGISGPGRCPGILGGQPGIQLSNGPQFGLIQFISMKKPPNK